MYISDISFAALIRSYVDHNGIKDLIEVAQVTERTARRWISGHSTPALHPQRKQISELIGCPMNVLVSLIEHSPLHPSKPCPVKPIQVYVACGLHKMGTARHFMRSFEGIGCQITYDWTVHGGMNASGPQMLGEIGHKELNGVKACDILVIIYPYGRRGSHFEMGAGYALGKDIVVVSEGKIEIADVPSFYYLDDVRKFEDFTPERANEVVFGRYSKQYIPETLTHTA